jgi:hypothetical protein
MLTEIKSYKYSRIVFIKEASVRLPAGRGAKVKKFSN